MTHRATLERNCLAGDPFACKALDAHPSSEPRWLRPATVKHDVSALRIGAWLGVLAVAGVALAQRWDAVVGLFG